MLDTIETFGPIEEGTESKVTIFTNGSGGKRTKDTGHMRLGMGLPRPGSDKEAIYGARWEAHRQYQGPNLGPYTIASKV